jgi:hypothetical protein
MDTLACFVEDFDSCLIQVLSELCKQFKNVTDYIRTHNEDRLGFVENDKGGKEPDSDYDETDEITKMLVNV